MRAPVFILAPPRSFTSVTCAMLGGHPQMYDLPEVNLFVAETMAARARQLAGISFHQHGLLRAVAELYFGAQSFQEVQRARGWIQERMAHACVSVFQELADRATEVAGADLVLDKSPQTTMARQHLLRMQRAYPHAYYIHLTRHPVSHLQSHSAPGRPLGRSGATRTEPTRLPSPPRDDEAPGLAAQWLQRHRNIMWFLARVPADLQVRIRGEDLLANPPIHLTKIAGWLGLPVEPDTVEAMLHPERSPYAFTGPPNAPYGDNPKFLEEPRLRHPSFADLDGALDRLPRSSRFSHEVVALAEEFGYT
jgi:Sulfotransferase family